MRISRRPLLLAPLAGLARAAGSGIVAKTAHGKVRGASVDGVHIFRGIPYGGPTEGTARWLPPSKAASWTGVRDCTANGLRCVQGAGNIFLSPTIGEYFGGGRPDRVELAQQSDSENCLVLNVLTPGLRGKRAVMVYVHGGGFTGGSSLLTVFSDRHVREQDVVLVGINHRLNVFGYTWLGGIDERYAAGNCGQLDLVAALEWVRDNIAEFGGDPRNVTIFGESGGGAKINALMAMPAARGLYHKACVQSGSMLNVPDAESGTKAAREMMSKLGVSSVEELAKVPAADLLKAAAGPGPVVDGRTIPGQTWDPVAPAISAGIPMIIGNCKDESSLFQLRNEGLYWLDDAGLRAELIKDRVPESKVDALLALYRRDHPRESPSELFFRISTDRGARIQAVKQADLKIAAGKAPVFLYYFEWNTPCVEGKIRAFHTADLPLTMRLVRYPESEGVSKRLSAAWAAFAKTGNPSQRGLEWPAYTASRRSTMMFGQESRAVDDPDRDERMMVAEMGSGRLL